MVSTTVLLPIDNGGIIATNLYAICKWNKRIHFPFCSFSLAVPIRCSLWLRDYDLGFSKNILTVLHIPFYSLVAKLLIYSWGLSPYFLAWVLLGDTTFAVTTTFLGQYISLKIKLTLLDITESIFNLYLHILFEGENIRVYQCQIKPMHRYISLSVSCNIPNWSVRFLNVSMLALFTAAFLGGIIKYNWFII